MIRKFYKNDKSLIDVDKAAHTTAIRGSRVLAVGSVKTFSHHAFGLSCQI